VSTSHKWAIGLGLAGLIIIYKGGGPSLAHGIHTMYTGIVAFINAL
jgi:hypothetical protein